MAEAARIDQPVGIRLDRVSARFHHAVAGDLQAVRDVSLSVEPGELLTLLGPSGCGKTTTLRMIAGFQQPSAGRIWIGDRDVTEVMANARDIGFVFQNYALFPHLSVFDNVAYGLVVRTVARPEIARRVDDVLQMVGLGRYGGQLPHQLSGGEQQRVALARAIVINPRVLLFDEPLSNLDAKLRVQMRVEIQRLQKRLGITAVYVTHDQEEAMAISDRIAVMNRGEIVQQGSAEMLYRQPADAFVAQFIGRSNLLTAHVRAASAGIAELEIEGHAHRITDAAADLAPGMTVQLVIRPETAALAFATDQGVLPGTVVSRTYLGDKTEYQIAVGATVIEVVAYNTTARSAAGERVGLRLPSTGIRILPEATR